MLNDNRQQYVIQSNDPKGDEWFGKFFGAVVLFVLFLAVVRYVHESVMAWYRDTMIWLNAAATYVADFWPF
ncbi:hypothetical protein ABIA22_004701 [Sinorhizobium fredii]|uniref:hypothetical protein n=1 Tax=Rhizobium fredii TaxID=380 RepID=UPI0035194F73